MPTSTKTISAGGSNLLVKNQGSQVTAAATSVDFTGPGVTTTAVGSDVSVAISGGSGSGGSALTIQKDSVTLVTSASLLNFVGNAVSASYSGNNVTLTYTSTGTGSFYQSPDLGITASFSASISHSLGMTPVLYQLSIINVTAEHGFTTGEEVMIASEADPTSGRGVSVSGTNTEILYIFGNAASTIGIATKDGGAPQPITNTKWNFRIRAWGQVGNSGTPYIMITHDTGSTAPGGGQASASVWVGRPLNTKLVDTNSLATLTSSSGTFHQIGKITLPAGTYRARASAFVGGGSNVWQHRLRDTTGNTTLINGTSNYITTAGIQSLEGRFTISTTSVLEFQYFGLISAAATDLGPLMLVGDTSGDNLRYATVIFEKES